MIKKACGKVYGASLTAAEKKAMDMEIQRQLAEYDRKHQTEINALILWQLHEQFNFGVKRMRRFYENFSPVMKELIDRYDMEDSDQIWLCTQMLKRCGVDIEKWMEDGQK